MINPSVNQSVNQSVRQSIHPSTRRSQHGDPPGGVPNPRRFQLPQEVLQAAVGASVHAQVLLLLDWGLMWEDFDDNSCYDNSDDDDGDDGDGDDDDDDVDVNDDDDDGDDSFTVYFPCVFSFNIVLRTTHNMDRHHHHLHHRHRHHDIFHHCICDHHHHHKQQPTRTCRRDWPRTRTC